MPSDLNLGIIFAAVRLRNEFTPEMQKVVAAAQKAGQEMQAAGRVLTLGITAPLVGAAAAAIKTSIDFESSFAGVRKTVTATEPELQALSDGFRELALEIPANVNELNKIGEAAGQLGIQTPNILGFTETMAALGVTTNLSSEAAATSLARLANITGLQQDEFDNLGSAIVGLGNNFATTESEIVDFGLRIAGAGELAGLSEGEILGIGTAMSSIGVQAEAGGTAVQKVLNEINQSVATGDEELRVFAEVAGVTAEQFSAAFRDDAAGAFESFVTGLGTQGDKSFTVMEDLGLESERVIRAFLGLANSGDLLSDAMEEGNKSFEENIALMVEAEQRYGTTESRLALLWARVRELGITLGDTLVPAVHSFINVAGPMLTFATDAVKWWSAWPGPLKVASLAVVALVAAVGPALLIGGSILTAWASITAVFPALGAAMAAAGLKATAFWVALSGPIGWVIAAIAAVTGAIFYFREELGLVKPSIEDMGLEAARQHVEDLEAQLDGLSSHALRNARAELEKARDGLAELEAAAVDADAAVETLTKDNFPAFAVTLHDAESQLAQAEDGLNQMAAAGMVVDAAMEDWVDGLEQHVGALKNTKTESDEVTKAIAEQQKALEALARSEAALLVIQPKLSLSYDEMFTSAGTATTAIGGFELELLHGIPTTLSLTEAVGLLGDETKVGLVLGLDEAAESAGNLDVTLAALAGGIGGATGQAINMATAMWQSNDALEAGEEGFSDAQIGAAVLGGVLGDLGNEIGGVAGKFLQAAGNIATAFATGGPVAGAIAGIIEGVKALGGWIDSMVNGAQMRFNDLSDAIVGSLDAIRDGSLTAAEAFDKAMNWEGNEEGYERLRETQQLWVAAGLSAEAATEWQRRYNEAVNNQDHAGLQALLVEYEGAVVAAEAAAEAAEKAAEAVRAMKEAWKAVGKSAAAAFFSARDAGEAAYDEMIQASADYHAAVADDDEELALQIIESNGEWVTNTEAAHEVATAAALAAKEIVLAAKGEEYARTAAFDAAMALGAHATSDERIAAARAAATAASESWDAAMVAVIASDKAASDAIDGTWNPNSGDVVNDIQDTTTVLKNEIADLERATKQEFEKMALDAGIEAEKMSAAFGVVFDPDSGTMIEDIDAAQLEAEQSFSEMTDPSKADSITHSIALAQEYMHAKLLDSDGSMTADFETLAENAAGSTTAIQASIDAITGKSIAINIRQHTTYTSDGERYDVKDGDEFHDGGFAGGTGGRFIDFGRGSNVKLHGKERIVTESEGRREAENNAASLRGVEDRLDRLDMNLQRAIKRISTDVTNVVMTKSL